MPEDSDQIARKRKKAFAMKETYRRSISWGVVSGLLTAVLWVLSIPPFNFPEAGYVAFIPLLLWFYTRPNPLASIFVVFGTGWVAWFAILIWLRHVTWLGTISLALGLAVIFALWALPARWLLPKLATDSFGWRLFVCVALAGLWVILEWMRSWIFWGFPWAPLSLSQWQRPAVLQVAAWTGAYGVSFILVFVNLCVAHTLRRRFDFTKRTVSVHWSSLEFYVAMALLVSCIVFSFKILTESDNEKTLFSVGIVQPYIPADAKWDEAKEKENLKILERQTRRVSAMANDLILWPEAATPWPILGDDRMRRRVEAFVREIGKPLLMGNLAWLPESDEWYNGAFLVYPETGLDENFYAKRRLVPFGEYVPASFRFIEKIVPLGGEFVPGEAATLIDLKVNGHRLKCGSLICYEDVFPALARESVRAGAEILYVATNNAWYGEEGGAVQHAAHSVLRAVENRRPVMRCGNGGWSGWIDAYGRIGDILVDQNDSVYFRGGGTFSISQHREWIGRQSFYTHHGEWFVAACGGWFVAALSLLLIRRRKKGEVRASTLSSVD